MKRKYSRTQSLVGTAVLVALVIVLQTIGSGIRLGPFTPTLSLVPIIIGAVLFGPLTGAVLGFVFSMIVLVSVVSGADAGGAIMFSQNAVATIIIVLLKGTLAGFASGFIVDRLAKKCGMTVAVALSAIAAPVCNTGIFCIGVMIFFFDLISGWGQAAGFENAFVYVVMGLIGINFLVELIIDLVLVPVIVRVITALRRSEQP
ncbi:MAG: ECF transporter S component [Lachnospiraceae bacterium]|nr:ECF transporter S component [Lachnospiraceae bacterium]